MGASRQAVGNGNGNGNGNGANPELHPSEPVSRTGGIDLAV